MFWLLIIHAGLGTLPTTSWCTVKHPHCCTCAVSLRGDVDCDVPESCAERPVCCHLHFTSCVQVLASHGSHDTPDINLVQTLPTILSSMHDYFIHVAAKLERVHNEVSNGHRGHGLQHCCMPVEGIVGMMSFCDMLLHDSLCGRTECMLVHTYSKCM